MTLIVSVNRHESWQVSLHSPYCWWNFLRRNFIKLHYQCIYKLNSFIAECKPTINLDASWFDSKLWGGGFSSWSKHISCNRCWDIAWETISQLYKYNKTVFPHNRGSKLLRNCTEVFEFLCAVCTITYLHLVLWLDASAQFYSYVLYYHYVYFQDC